MTMWLELAVGAPFVVGVILGAVWLLGWIGEQLDKLD